MGLRQVGGGPRRGVLPCHLEKAMARLERTAVYLGASVAAQELSDGLEFYAEGVDADLIDFMRDELGTLMVEGLCVFMHETAARALGTSPFWGV